MTDFQKELSFYRGRCGVLEAQVVHYKHSLLSPCTALGALLGGDGKVLKKEALERLGLWELDWLREQLSDEDFVQ